MIKTIGFNRSHSRIHSKCRYACKDPFTHSFIRGGAYIPCTKYKYDMIPTPWARASITNRFHPPCQLSPTGEGFLEHSETISWFKRKESFTGELASIKRAGRWGILKRETPTPHPGYLLYTRGVWTLPEGLLNILLRSSQSTQMESWAWWDAVGEALGQPMSS